MIIPQIEKKRTPKLKRPCSRCGKMFIPTGFSNSERLCVKCFDKARSKKR